MTDFVLPLTVRTADTEIDLLVDLPGPTPIGQVLPDILRCAGLAVGSVLHLGVGEVDSSWLLGRAPLLAGRTLSIRPDTDPSTVGVVNLSCVAGPDAGGSVPLAGEPVVIGRDTDCDLALDDPELSRRHARVELSDGELSVVDLDSSNGIVVDGEPRPRAGPGRPVPRDGLIRLGGSVFRIGLTPEPPLLRQPDGAGRVAVPRPARVAPDFQQRVSVAPGPPPSRSRRPVPLMAAVMGGVTGVVIALITGMWTFLLLAALGPVMMLSTGMSDRLSGRRSFRRALREHNADVAERETQLRAATAADREDAWDRYPDPATLARRAASGSVRLWERRAADPDYLRLCIGIGERPTRLDDSDPPMTTEVPITVALASIGVLGIAGECRGLLRNLLLQLSVLHSPADLEIHLFSDAPDVRRIRDLPHAQVQPTPARAAQDVARLLQPAGGPMVVVVLDGADRWRRTPRMNELLAAAARPVTAAAGLTETFSRPSDHGRLVAICVAPDAPALPIECTAVAMVSGGRVCLRTAANTVTAETVGVSQAHLVAVISHLAPLVDPDQPGGGLPDDLRLTSLLGAEPVPVLMRGAWAAPSLRFLLGAGRAEPVAIDLELDGPHMLIAGTTGSGKSELLKTLVAGLACAAPPSRTAFLLIDYKGGAAFGRLADLPHTTGVITDLDRALATRALRSLRAEVRHRERVLAGAGVADLAELRARGQEGCPPSLVVVVDEFATLGADRPEFLVGLLDVAQRGRSLGVHLVLATQRPAGVLSPAMKANIGLRVCLRVTDDADSVDVIDSPDAARLPLDQPGRAFLRREKSRTTLLQVARTSGSRATGIHVRLRDDPQPWTTVPEGPTDLDEIIDSAKSASRGMRLPQAPWLPSLPSAYQPDGSDILALLDEPDEQRQTPLLVPPGSALILGPAGSGRSSALRRLAWCAGTDGCELVVVDPSGGLRELAGWPGTRTYLDGQDPTLVQRLISRLRLELASRSDRGSPILMVVDGWESMIASVDGLDYGASAAVAADLVARGASAGIRVATSGDLRMQHHRTAGGFATVIRLGVDERNDPCGGPPGRGRLGPAEIQVADCPALATPPPDVVGRCAPVVRALPAIVSAAELPPARLTAVPLGLGDDDGSPQTIDLGGPGGALLVAGPRRSGVSTVLDRLAVGAATAGLRVVRAVLRTARALPRVQDVDLRLGGDRLRSLLVAHDGPILLIADDLDNADWPDETLNLFERFITVAGPGQYCAIGTRLDRALRAHRGPIAAAAAFRTGVLLHPDSADGSLFDVTLPRRRGHPPPGRGYLVQQGRAIPVQLARDQH